MFSRYVQEKIYDEFVKRSAERAKSIKVGDPFSATTNQGPQVDSEQMNKIIGYINKGKEQARLVTGGNRVGKKGVFVCVFALQVFLIFLLKGFFVEPTVFADVKDEHVIAKEEIFGPVMSILKFKTVDEVIRRANNSVYGLGAGVVTKSLDNAIKISNGLRAGTVYVNCYDVFDRWPPLFVFFFNLFLTVFCAKQHSVWRL